MCLINCCKCHNINKKVTTSCGNVQGSNSFWNSSTDHAWKKFTAEGSAEGSATGLLTTGMCKQKTKLIIFTFEQN